MEEERQKLVFDLVEVKESAQVKDQRLEEKDRQLEESVSQITKLEKSNDEITKLKADIKFIKQQWEKSAYEIKDNILAQCRVICPEADFGEISLDKHGKDGCIEVAP